MGVNFRSPDSDCDWRAEMAFGGGLLLIIEAVEGVIAVAGKRSILGMGGIENERGVREEQEKDGCGTEADIKGSLRKNISWTYISSHQHVLGLLTDQ